MEDSLSELNPPTRRPPPPRRRPRRESTLLHLLYVDDPSISPCQRKALMWIKLVIAVMWIAFAVLQTVLTAQSYHRPTWLEYVEPLNEFVLPQILVCPQWVKPGDPSSSDPRALVGLNCSYWNGVDGNWWTGNCGHQRLIANYFGTKYHCLLYNGGHVDGTNQGIVVRAAYGLIKFAVDLNYSTVDDGTQFLTMYYFDPTSSDKVVAGGDLDLGNKFARVLVDANTKVIKSVALETTVRFAHLDAGSFFAVNPATVSTSNYVEIQSTALSMNNPGGPTTESKVGGIRPLRNNAQVIVELSPSAMQESVTEEHIAQNNIYFVGAIGGGFGAARLMYKLIHFILRRCCTKKDRARLRKEVSGEVGRLIGRDGKGAANSASGPLWSSPNMYGVRGRGAGGMYGSTSSIGGASFASGPPTAPRDRERFGHRDRASSLRPMSETHDESGPGPGPGYRAYRDAAPSAKLGGGHDTRAAAAEYGVSPAARGMYGVSPTGRGMGVPLQEGRADV